MKKYKPTEKQKRVIKAVISGEAKNMKEAKLAAGYSENSANKGIIPFIKAKGVQSYIAKLDKKAQLRWKMSLPDKVMEVYMDGLGAEKLVGSDAIPTPDHMTRKAFADTFSRFFGWEGELQTQAGKYTQFNFFSVNEKQRGAFNKNFKQFLKHFYKNE